jgi:hypothetical protein
MSFKERWRREKQRNSLKKRARKGFRGYPLATVAFYGPDNQRASKVVVGVIQTEGEPAILKKWFSETDDVRSDPDIAAEMTAFMEEHGALSVAMSNGLMGCPHEEGIDYPEGEKCPMCPYWANRNRSPGKS